MGTISTIAVYGLGQFGFALAHHLGKTHSDDASITIKGTDYDKEVVEKVQAEREQPYHFDGFKISKKVEVVSGIDELLEDTDLLIMAVPAQRMRESLERIKSEIHKNIVILNVAKALERDTNLTMSKIGWEVLEGIEYGYTPTALSGGMKASEFIKGYPLGADLACEDLAIAAQVRDLFLNHELGNLRIYTTTDLGGVEYAGAAKNVYSIAAGLSDGLGYPPGTKSFLVSRAAKEGVRIGEVVASDPSTFSIGSQCWGGDLMLSCFGTTRNRQFGEHIGSGNMTSEEALRQMEEVEHMTVEGYATTAALHDLGMQKGLDLPIIDGVHAILYDGKDPKRAVQDLMNRTQKQVGE
ncbi:MAG: NAD(P)H-dependent glycerol-3-phosphate dehydrogenase [archaeon]